VCVCVCVCVCVLNLDNNRIIIFNISFDSTLWILNCLDALILARNILNISLWLPLLVISQSPNLILIKQSFTCFPTNCDLTLSLYADFIINHLFLYSKTRFKNYKINKIWLHLISQIFFCNDYTHDLIMNFLLNRFYSKSKKFMIETAVHMLIIAHMLYLAETPLSYIRSLSHNRRLYPNF